MSKNNKKGKNFEYTSRMPTYANLFPIKPHKILILINLMGKVGKVGIGWHY